MNNWNGSLWLLTLFVFFFSCDRAGDGNELPGLNKKVQEKGESFVLFSPDGDTIPTGVPIPAQGKRIDPDSVAKPKTIPIPRPPEVIQTSTKVYPAGKPKTVQIPKQLKVIIPGQDGIPRPDSVSAQGKVVPALFTAPVSKLPPQKKDDANYDIQYLDMDQGMLSPYISSMLQDSRGHLWFGTTQSGGVSRYDGHSFTHFTPTEGLSGMAVYSILEDSRGNLWFGTTYGLNRYDGLSFTQFTTEEGLSSNWIHSMLEDSHGKLWFGTRGGGVICYDPDAYDGQGSFTPFTIDHGLSANYVISMLEDSQGNLWFGTASGLNRYDPDAYQGQGSFTRFTTEEGLSHNAIYSMLEDSRGKLWFGTASGLNHYDPDAYDGHGSFTQFTTEEGLSHNGINDMLEDRQGKLWLGTRGGGVSCYDPDGYDGRGSFTHITTEEGLSHDMVFNMLEDHQGNLWFGTNGGGVCRYDPSMGSGQAGFTHFTTKEGLSFNAIISIFEDRQGHIWFGTARRGVNRLDLSASPGQISFTQFTTKEGLISDLISSLLEDSQGNLWIGSASGLTRYNPSGGLEQASLTYFTFRTGLSRGGVFSMLEDSQGNLWFGTPSGLNRYDGQSFTHFTIEEGLSDNEVTSVLEDSKGHLWMGTGKGVSRYDPDAYDGQGSFTHFSTEYVLGSNDYYIMSMFEDSKGNLWFGTRGGLSRFDGRDFTYYPVKTRFSFDFITSIAEDSEKNIWAGSRKSGIMLLVPPSDNAPSDDYEIFYFDQEDGLLHSEINSIYLDTRNRIWLGSGGGVSLIDPEQFKLPREAPKSLRLSHIEIKEQYVDFRRLDDSTYHASLSFDTDLSHSFDSVAPFYNYPLDLSLPHRLNHLSFYFSAIDWAAPHKIRYSYKMDNGDWSAWKPENKADYRNIPYGRHTLQVKAIGGAQIESETFEYTFTIRPPWWQSWWAYTLYGLLTIVLLIALYRFLLNRRLEMAETLRLRELDQVKTKLYTNITHEFRTPLTVIMGMTDEIEKPEPKSLIRRNSRYLLNLVNQMLDLSKLESGRLKINMIQGDICAYLRYLLESFHSYAESKDIGLHFQSNIPELVMDYEPEKLQQIIANLLSNAIKFTPEGGAVHLTLDVVRDAEDGELLTINVKDSGIGIPEDQLIYIFDRFYQVDDSATRRGEGTGIGLTLTQELIKLLGGDIRVQSREGEGTVFAVSLPVYRDAPIVAEMASARFSVQGWEVTDKPAMAVDETDPENPLALIVEDNPDVQQYLQNCLSGAYRIATAFDGQAGMDKALELTPDIIISDVMMPGQDGFALTRKLKTDPRTSHIPIILLTAKADMESRLEGLEGGADAYLAKPFEREELLLRMRKLLELRRRLRQYYLSLAVATVSEPAPEEAVEEHATEHAFVQQVRTLVEKHLLDSEYSVDQLCRGLAMSRSQLHRKLTALTGYSANRFIRYIRLSRARELLRDSELPIGNIAYDSGFSDPVYFSRVFKQEFGMTPTEWREG